MKETANLLKKVLDNPGILETVSKDKPLLERIQQHVELQKKTKNEGKSDEELIKEMVDLFKKI